MVKLMAQYIGKSDLVAEIERLQNDEFLCDSYDMATGFQSALRMVQEFINTLEVKEVDLEKEAENFVQTGEFVKNENPVLAIAKHFFELGLKAKGE